MIRYILGIPFAVGVTLSLFFLMRFLITQELEPPEKLEGAGKIEIAREKRDENVRREDATKRPERKDQPPPPPKLDQSRRPPKADNVQLDLSSLQGVDLDMSTNFRTDADVQPIVRVPPQYPQRAASRGIEGWCLVEFTVTEDGSVIDPVVLDSEPPGTWDNAVKRAVVRWKYNPRLEGGKPVAWKVQTVLTFELEK
ncbi:MAG: energy transducer TonB [Alphaproteobacteria bacterium]|nr:MAG: energy transducer TonB [Alphaproteobacteria bacterium]